ncbi:MAG: transcription-repair coupling factor [Dehalococcoidia bacterium]
MNLHALLPALAVVPPLTEVYARLEARAKVTLGLIDASKAVTAALLWRRQRAPVLLVVPREVDAEAMLDQVRAWAGDAAAHFPARGTLPYAEDGPNPSVTAQRLAVLSRLAHATSGGEPPLVVASTAAVIEHTLRPADLGRGPGLIEAGMRLPLDTLATRLVEAGYVIEPLVQEAGEAARRGGILDVFPPDAESPLRIEWFGSEIESIRAFDPATQRTRGQLERAVIGPAHEWFADRADLVQLAARLDGLEGPELEEHLHALRRGELPQPARYGPLATDATLLDHLPAGALLILDEREAVEAAASDLEDLAVERRGELTAHHQLTAAAPLPQASRSAFEVALDRQLPRVDLSRWATGTEPGSFRLPFQPRDAYAGRLPAAASDTMRELRRGDRVVAVTQQAQRYREVLAEAEVDASVVSSVDAPLAAGAFALVQGALPEGWQVATPQGVVSLTTDRELFGFVKRRRTLRRAGSASQRSRFLAEVAPGDFVVHADHGIARFAGIVRRAVGDEERDYLELRYAGDDRLYVPIDQVDRVTRYVGPSEHIPRLTRLGTQEWNHARARVREAVTLVAADLLRLYAARQLLHGHAFREDTPWQLEMEAAFPFEETEDQLRTIAEVKADMESPRPMDRLICGDVGFGKTEVAVRAAFKAVMDGMQVAVLVPTTVLAQQHERTFRERLAAFPVRIEVLSRFRSDHEARAIVAALKVGEVDIVIGTHRLLQPNVEFSNLGLVIIDEEQRFGVAHKERLKRMRLEVDVLSLSATPIPRTLHMSLTGIRDMSSIESAPVDRHPVQTFVAEWDPALVREAILRELDRGGQVYVVHNRVQSIDLLADRLRELVPHARVVVGHGQMSEVLLENVMERFADAEYDILVCTTIIESGIDIPNVNTLIIDNADQLGLAQLYQLRGRVGRSTQQAYAYLLHSRERILSEVAQQRLATIFEATELGSGFQVALRDLEIRGAGNLLGAEQSGQIASVGFDLYTQMLAEAVEEMKAKTSTAIREEVPVAQPVVAPARPARAVKIDLPVSAFIPESYVEEIEARLALYQRIAGLASLADTEALRAETADRLGPLPEALDHLFALVRVRLAAAAAEVASVRLEEGEIVVTAREDRPFGPRRLPSLPRAVRIGRTQLRLPRSGLGERWLDGVEALLRLVATGAAQPEREAVAAG